VLPPRYNFSPGVVVGPVGHHLETWVGGGGAVGANLHPAAGGGAEVEMSGDRL
jgi:hypothetical protein